MDGEGGRGGGDVLFILELVAEIKDLDLYIAGAVVREDLLVGLPLAVLDAVEVFGVGSDGVPGAEVGKVPLNVARGAAAAGGGETNVGGHGKVIASNGQDSGRIVKDIGRRIVCC